MKRIITFLCFIVLPYLGHGQVVNKAVSFTGALTSKASFGNITELNHASKFTFEAWVYIDTWKQNSFIFCKGIVENKKIAMQLGAASKKRLYFYIGNKYVVSDNSEISVGQWHHIAVVYDGMQSAYHMISVLIDKTPVSLAYSGNDGILPSATPSTNVGFELGRGFAGKIDEVRLWNISLTPDELDLTNTISRYHPLYKHLVSYWRMDQNEGKAVTDNKLNYPGFINNASFVIVKDNPDFEYKIVSTYIRPNFFESGLISDESILNNNDIIYMTGNPCANGDLFFESPANNGTLKDARYLHDFSGRDGIISFSGNGSSLNCGKDLLNTATTGIPSFTFSSWVYIDKWITGSYIFKKYSSALNTIDLQLGNESTSSLIFHIASGSENDVTLNNSGLTPGQWHHIAIAYQGNACAYQQVKIFVDGLVQSSLIYKNADGLLPANGSFIHSDLELGVNFSGKLDETSINLLSLNQQEIQKLKNNTIIVNSINESKTVAYWKYDDPQLPGKNYRSWLVPLDKLKQILSGHPGVKLRLGLSGGNWKEMSKSDLTRRNFAGNVKKALKNNKLDGVDLDFEWCENDEQWTNYSNTILAIKDSLPANCTFTVTLHPLYFKINQAAIAAVDYVSIQSYGPRPVRFPYDQFVKDVNSAIAYGYPRNKLIMGMPFYGTSSDNTRFTTSYRNIVSHNPTLNPEVDEVELDVNTVTGFGCNATQQTLSKNITFNGQQTIINKTRFVLNQHLAGVMYWDLATDVNYAEKLSLLRGLNTVVNANIDSGISGHP